MTQTQHTDEPSVDDVYSRDVPAEMLNSPVFEAVWSVVKHWDVGVPAAYGGYCARNGSHVAAIVNALARLSRPTLSAAATEIAQNLIANGGITRDQANHALDIVNANVLTLARALKQ